MRFFKLKYSACMLLMLTACLSSCDFQKRLYRKGFYVPGKDSERMKTANHQIAQKENKTISSRSQDPAPQKILEQPAPGKIAQGLIIFPKRKNNRLKTHTSDFRENEQGVDSRLEKSIKAKFPKPAPEEINFAEEKKINTLFLIAFICGIAGFLLYVPAIAAVICGAIGRQKQKQFPYKVKRNTIGTIGFIFGIVMLSILLLSLGIVLMTGGF